MSVIVIFQRDTPDGASAFLGSISRTGSSNETGHTGKTSQSRHKPKNMYVCLILYTVSSVYVIFYKLQQQGDEKCVYHLTQLQNCV